MARDPQQERQHLKLAQVIAKAWTDQSFKQRLIANPAGRLPARASPSRPASSCAWLRTPAR
jgi:hypothetical protein